MAESRQGNNFISWFYKLVMPLLTVASLTFGVTKAIYQPKCGPVEVSNENKLEPRMRVVEQECARNAERWEHVRTVLAEIKQQINSLK